MEQLRKTHNGAKREFIKSVVYPKDRVLDVGCGRGGDLLKWKSAKVLLTAVDPDQESIIEAQSRLEGMRAKDGVSSTSAWSISLGDICSAPPGPYDVICYNFSLQYIFANQQLLSSSLDAIRERLDVGGLLIGTIPDSDNIMQLPLKWVDSLDNSIERGPSIGKGLVGEMILVKLSDGPYYKYGAIPEPLAHKQILIEELAHRNFTLIQWTPMLPNKTGLISDIYSQFIFRKNAV